jgi:hypothetical protein
VQVYKRNGLTFTKLPDLNVMPSAVYDNGIAFSPDGQHLTVSGAGYSAGLAIFKGTQGLIVPSIGLQGKGKAFIKTGK